MFGIHMIDGVWFIRGNWRVCILVDLGLVKVGLLDFFKCSQCLLNTEFCRWGILEYCRNGRGVTCMAQLAHQPQPQSDLTQPIYSELDYTAATDYLILRPRRNIMSPVFSRSTKLGFNLCNFLTFSSAN